MTTIAIVPENPGSPATTFRAVMGALESTGQTPGQALDALAAKLGSFEGSAFVVVQSAPSDLLFSEQQQQRLVELMDRWRSARDTGSGLTVDEQAELESLVEAEIQAATMRAAGLAQGLAQ